MTLHWRLSTPSIVQAAVLLAAVLALGSGASVTAQELVVTPDHDFNFSAVEGSPVVVVADLARSFPQPVWIYIAPLGNAGPTLHPQGLALFSANVALVSHVVYHGGSTGGAIDIIDTAQAQRIGRFSLAGYEGDGLGTLAIDRAKTHLLVFSGLSSNKLFVVPAPFSATSTAATVMMPSNGGTAQTHAIAFDNATGRAYVGHVAGISALDPPYTSIAFTIPLPTSAGFIRGRAVALSADGATLASTVYGDAKVQVLHAPFSAASAPTELTVPGAIGLDGLTFTPDGTQLLAVDSNFGSGASQPTAPWSAAIALAATTPSAPSTLVEIYVYAIAAPFDTNAPIQPLDTGISGDSSGPSPGGFEDIDISADGQYAALSGGDEDGSPLVILRAPFTTTAVRPYPLDIPPVPGGYPNYDGIGGRGSGTARFWSAPLAAPPQISNDTIVSATEGDSGTSPLPITVRLSRPSAQSVSVDYATANHSLTAPDRYLATAGTLTFAPGETRKTVSVPIVGNTVQDGSGDFLMNFSNPVHASLLETGARVECDIIDNDGTFIITTNSPLPDGFVGAPYSLAFHAQGEPGYSNWGVFNSNLPAGLSLDPVTGVLSGVSTAVGTSIFDVIVSDAAFTVSTNRSYQITIGSDRIFANGFE